MITCVFLFCFSLRLLVKLPMPRTTWEQGVIIIYIVIGNRLRWAHLGESVADVSHWWLARIGSPGLFLKILNYLPSIFMDLKISHKNLDPILRIKILTQNSWHWTVPFFFRCIHFPVCHNPHCCLILLQYYLPDPCSI